MAEDGEKRDPSSHRTPKQITRLSRGYNHQPEIIKRRDNSNKARKMLDLKKGDPRDAHHVVPQRSGGATTKSNLRPLHKSKNRGWEKPRA